MRTRDIDGAARAALFSVASLSLVTISLSTSLVDGQSADPVRRVRQPVAGTYLVALLRDDDPHSVASETARKFRGRVRRVYRATRGFAIRLPHAAAQVLARDARVAFVEEDGIVAAATVQRRPPSWGLDRIDQRDLRLTTAIGIRPRRAAASRFISSIREYARGTTSSAAVRSSPATSWTTTEAGRIASATALSLRASPQERRQAWQKTR